MGGQVEGEVEGRHERAGPDGELAHHGLEPLCARAQIHWRILACSTMTNLIKKSAGACLDGERSWSDGAHSAVVDSLSFTHLVPHILAREGEQSQITFL